MHNDSMKAWLTTAAATSTTEQRQGVHSTFAETPASQLTSNPQF